MKTKVCVRCGMEKEIARFHLSWNGSKRKHICNACYGDRERAKLKLDMFKALGDKCECCGETHPAFLTLDHRLPGEGEHATGLNNQQLYRLARRQGWPKDRYQVLCYNCNAAKGHFGRCPHQSKITAEGWLTMLNYHLEKHGRKYVKRDYTGLALGPAAFSAKAKLRRHWGQEVLVFDA